MVVSFTVREQELMHLMAQGLRNGPISEAMGISRKTVENSLLRIYDSLDVASDARYDRRVLAVLWILKNL